MVKEVLAEKGIFEPSVRGKGRVTKLSGCSARQAPSVAGKVHLSRSVREGFSEAAAFKVRLEEGASSGKSVGKRPEREW